MGEERQSTEQLPAVNESGLRARVGAQSGTDVYAQVGEHVASVIRAAETAAAALTAQAEREAAAVREAAQAEAAQMVKDAEADVEDAKNEARAVREKAEHEARLARDEARAYADKQRREAHEEAKKLVESAKNTATREVEDARNREQAQLRAIAQTEKRLAELTGGLRDVVSRLDELAAAPGETVDEALHEAVAAAANPKDRPVG